MSILSNLKYALHGLRQAPGFAAVVIGTLGVLLAVVASPLLSMVVDQATSRDALTLAAAGVMVLVGLAAAAGPAWRTVRVDPATTLREG